MECTTTRRGRAERGRNFTVLAASVLFLSALQFVCLGSATAQVAKPPAKKQAHTPAKPAKSVDDQADQLNAKWLADYNQTPGAPPAASAGAPPPSPSVIAQPAAPTSPTTVITPSEEDRFFSLATKAGPVSNGAHAVVPGSVSLVKATSASAFSMIPGGSNLANYKEIAQAFSGFAPSGGKVEMIKGQTADGNTRLLFASVGEGKGKQSFWWFTPPDQPEGWFDDQGHRLGGTMLADPKPGSRISSPFGTRRYYGRRTSTAFHNGIDFEGKFGEPIYAAADGVINHMGWYYNYGRTVKITHADSFETLYAHMSRFPPGMGAGTFVHKGELIGYVGSTGRSTGPHLHFSTIVNGQFVDPEPYLSEEGDGQLNGQALVAFRQWQQDIRLATDPKKATVIRAKQAQAQPQAASPEAWSQSPFAPRGNALLGHL